MDDQITFARNLRRDQTPAERRFWVLLHPWRVAGWHFRRQAPIGPFAVDFVCKREKLVLEIDGDGHYSDEGMARDFSRTAYLRRLGYSVLRFTNDDVLGQRRRRVRGAACHSWQTRCANFSPEEDGETF